MNVLIVRADGIGDALACAPLVAALRGAGHTLGIVLGTRNRDIYARRAFESVHVLERIPWPRHGSTGPSRVAALRDARAQRYDVAVIASEEMEAYRFAARAGIASRAGFINGWEKPLKTLRVRALLSRAVVRSASAGRAREHEVETIFRLGAGLHTETAPTRDVARLAPLILDDRVPLQGHVVVQVTAKFATDGLDRDAYAALVRALQARGHAVLLAGDEREIARGIAEATGAAAEPAGGVVAWKARIAGARALVSPDSGAAHVAGMLGVPCVDCFPPRASTARDVLRWRPWAAPYRAHVLNPARSRGHTGAALARAVDELLAMPRPIVHR